MFQKQFLAVSSPPSAVAATANQHPQPLQSSLLSVTLESAGVRPGIMGDAYAAQLCFHRNSGLLGEYFDPLGSLQVPNEDESCRCFEKFQTRLGQEDTAGARVG